MNNFIARIFLLNNFGIEMTSLILKIGEKSKLTLLNESIGIISFTFMIEILYYRFASVQKYSKKYPKEKAIKKAKIKYFVRSILFSLLYIIGFKFIYGIYIIWMFLYFLIREMFKKKYGVD